MGAVMNGHGARCDLAISLPCTPSFLNQSICGLNYSEIICRRVAAFAADAVWELDETIDRLV